MHTAKCSNGDSHCEVWIAIRLEAVTTAHLHVCILVPEIH